MPKNQPWYCLEVQVFAQNMCKCQTNVYNDWHRLGGGLPSRLISWVLQIGAQKKNEY